MKKVLFSLVIILFVCCSRSNNTNGSALWFHVEINNPQNIDCGLPEIIFLTNQNEAYQVIGNDAGTYIALGLPNINYQTGDKLWVKIRKPGAGEEVVCHALGIAWAHVFISETK